MGCDCTMFLEAYDTTTAQWECLEGVDVGRDYELFGLLAGVRGIDFDPIVDPRGYPRDLGRVTRQVAEQYKGHTPSFLYADEIMAVCDGKSRTSRENKRLLKRVLAALRRHKTHPPERVRIVFWFDS